MEEGGLLVRSLQGDINAFQQLFEEFRPQLKSYLYRLLASRDDAEDLTQDTFVKGFDKIRSFKSNSSFKTWIFTIATRLAYDELRKRKRWSIDAQDQSKSYAQGNENIQHRFRQANQTQYGAYEIREHIDFCFTCISKTIGINDQIILILKDIYDFTLKDISGIMQLSVASVKNHLHDARATLIDIFDKRCALVSKLGPCHQCSELNGVFNPKQNQRQILMEIRLVQEVGNYSNAELFKLRTLLIKNIDPLQSNGANLQDEIMKCTREAIGETSPSQTYVPSSPKK